MSGAIFDTSDKVMMGRDDGGPYVDHAVLPQMPWFDLHALRYNTINCTVSNTGKTTLQHVQQRLRWPLNTSKMLRWQLMLPDNRLQGSRKVLADGMVIEDTVLTPNSADK